MTASDPRVGEDCATCLGCPDCGTTLSKRTPEAIALRLGKVSDGPWTAWNRGIGYEVHGPLGEPINDGCRETFTRGDAEFIAAAPADIPYLLAELADRDEKLAKVEVVAAEFDAKPGHRWAASRLRAAVAAANGGGEQCLSVHAGRQCLLRPGHAPVTGQTYGHIYPAEDS